MGYFIVSAAAAPGANFHATAARGSVYHYVCLWRNAGLWEEIHTRLRELTRQRAGGDPTPNAAIIAAPLGR